MGCSIPDARSQRAVYAFGVELMRTHKYFIGFGITVGIILLVTVTSRMALQGSLLAEQMQMPLPQCRLLPSSTFSRWETRCR